MGSLQYIFGNPDYIDKVGYIYPIKLKDYSEFIDCSNCLYISKNHFEDDYQVHPLLELIYYGVKEINIETHLKKLLSLVTRKNVEFYNINDEIFFRLETGEVIDSSNYELIREIIMRQNLMFEQKIYKDKRVQAIMYKVFEARSKSSVKMEFEDIVSTVSVFTGKHYSDLAEYTVYQLKTDFNRISKFKQYDTNVAFKCVSSSNIDLGHFAENLDMFKNPYDLDNFTKSKDKVNKLNAAME